MPFLQDHMIMYDNNCHNVSNVTVTYTFRNQDELFSPFGMYVQYFIYDYHHFIFQPFHNYMLQYGISQMLLFSILIGTFILNNIVLFSLTLLIQYTFLINFITTYVFTFLFFFLLSSLLYLSMPNYFHIHSVHYS